MFIEKWRIIKKESSPKRKPKKKKKTNIRGTQRRFPIQSTFRSLAMNSTWRYKICICSVILARGTWVFSKLQGSKYYFLENLRGNFKFYESENFSDSSLHRIFESENFRFPFSTKNSPSWGLKCQTLNSV